METPQSSAAPALPTESLETGPCAGKRVDVEMVLRVWSAPAKTVGEDAPNRKASHNPSLISFIEDIVAAKQGTFRATRSQLSVSGLKRATDALVIARQIQFGLQGFRGKPGAEPLAVSIAVDASSKSDSPADSRAGSQPNPGAGVESTFEFDREPLAEAEPSHDLLTLLKLSKPSQILVTHDLCERSAAIKSLPLKSFPARFGIYEYLWTAPEKLDLLQSEPQLTLVTVPSARPPLDDAEPQAEHAVQAAPSELTEPTMDSQIESTHIERASAKSERTIAGVLFTPRFAILGGVVVVAIAIASFVGSRMAHESTPQPVVQHSSSSNAGSAAPGSVAVPPSGTVPAASDTAGSSEARTQQQSPVALGKANQKRPATAPPKTAPVAVCNLTGSISSYLPLAEQARGRGDYARAIRLFTEILDCEPSNGTAKEGLARSIEGREQKRHAQ